MVDCSDGVAAVEAFVPDAGVSGRDVGVLSSGAVPRSLMVAAFCDPKLRQLQPMSVALLLASVFCQNPCY